MAKGLEVATAFEVVGSDVADEGANPVDVVGETHDADDLDEDEAQRLKVVGGHEIPEPNRQHDVDSPVVGPDVLLEPPS